LKRKNRRNHNFYEFVKQVDESSWSYPKDGDWPDWKTEWIVRSKGAKKQLGYPISYQTFEINTQYDSRRRKKWLKILVNFTKAEWEAFHLQEILQGD
jgi:hypothetical protein